MISFEKAHDSEKLDFTALSKYFADEKVEEVKIKLQKIYCYTVSLSKSYGMEASSTLCFKHYYDILLRQKLSKINDEASA